MWRHVHQVVVHLLNWRLLVLIVVRLPAQRLNLADVAGRHVRLAGDLAQLLRELATRLTLNGTNAAGERRYLLEVRCVKARVTIRPIDYALGILQQARHVAAHFKLLVLCVLTT